MLDGPIAPPPATPPRLAGLSPLPAFPALPQFSKYAVGVARSPAQPLGLAVEVRVGWRASGCTVLCKALAWRLSGCLVREISPGGAVAQVLQDCSAALAALATQDGRLRPGDLLLAVNHESVWRVTSSQARAVLRRADLLSGAITSVKQTIYICSVSCLT